MFCPDQVDLVEDKGDLDKLMKVYNNEKKRATRLQEIKKEEEQFKDFKIDEIDENEGFAGAS